MIADSLSKFKLYSDSFNITHSLDQSNKMLIDPIQDDRCDHPLDKGMTENKVRKHFQILDGQPNPIYCWQGRDTWHTLYPVLELCRLELSLR